MRRYKYLSGHPGVAAYELDGNSITVEFHKSSRHLYTSASVGAEHIRQMQQLARRIAGLPTFVSRLLRERYARSLQ